MKLFVKHTALFLITFFGLLVLIVTITSVVERKRSNFKLPETPSYLIVGHSHPECAFNDSLIPNLKNISYSGESYFYTYFKTKEVIKHNPSIEVIFIELTNNQISTDMNDWIWGDEFMTNNYQKYSSFMTYADNFLLLKNNPSSFMNALIVSTTTKANRLFGNKFDRSNELDGYRYLQRDKTDSLIKSNPYLTERAISEKRSRLGDSISEINLIYLDKLVDFCQQQGKKVFLIRSPQHDKYDLYATELTYKHILNTRYKNVEYLDFSNFPLSNAEFGDLEHLNYKGAKRFSEWFAELLNKGLLKQPKKQDFIKQKMLDLHTC